MRFHSRLALLVAASALASIVHAEGTPSWADYRSTVSNAVDIDDSFNRPTETNTTTTTDNSKKTAIEDSYNRSTDIKTTRTTDIDTTTDNSKHATDSFNRSTDIKTSVDASKHVDDSYNTDIKKSTDNSI